MLAILTTVITTAVMIVVYFILRAVIPGLVDAYPEASHLIIAGVMCFCAGIVVSELSWQRKLRRKFGSGSDVAGRQDLLDRPLSLGGIERRNDGRDRIAGPRRDEPR